MPPPTTPPAAPTLAIASTLPTINGNPVTHLTDLGFTGTTIIGTFVTVTETWTNPPSTYTGTTTMVVPQSAITYNSDGTFNFAFQDFSDSIRQPRHQRDLHGLRHGDLHE